MCLCSQLDSRVNKVCLNCHTSKKGFRRFGLIEKCQFCRSELIDIGSKIEVPKKSNIQEWKKLKKIISATKYFSVCQCGSEDKNRKFRHN